jgi:hypothetical protein
VLARVRSRLSYANVMSTIGCFVALGGTAYAVNTVGSDDVINNSLLSEDVQNGTLGGVDLRENTIGSARVVDDSLTSADIKDDTLTADDIKNGQINSGDVQDDTLTADDLKNGTIGSSDVAANSLGGGRITDNSLKGTDIQESSLTGIAAAGASPLAGTPTVNPAFGTDFSDHTVDVPAAGRLLVQGWAPRVVVTCKTAGSCSVDIGLYVDGAPVPGTEVKVSSEAGESSEPVPVFVTGIIPVQPGERVVGLGVNLSEDASTANFGFAQTNSIFVKD